jgi:hypothetical protein
LHPKFCIVSDRPETCEKDDLHRPHCGSGPSHVWRDGWKIWHWRGQPVPRAWIESPGSLDPSIALTWPNIEQRRVAAEIIGWRRVLEQLNPIVVNVDDDPEIGELLEVELPDAGKARFLKVRCGTGRDFMLSVPIEMKTALQANSWTYDIDPKKLKKLEART